MLTGNEVPTRAAGVVVRAEPEGVLLFQGRTDQMYFTSPAAFALFSLCDGTRTICEIEDLVAVHDPRARLPQSRTRLGDFLEDLAARQLIELWG
jgi:hypothetical protein